MLIVFTQLFIGPLDDRKKAMAYVESVLRKLAFNKVPYRKSIVEVIKNRAAGIVYLGLGKKLPQLQLASEEIMTKETASWDEKLRKQYVSKIESFLKICGEKFALTENERIVCERFTYLEEAFKRHGKYTPVLYRRTNMAEYVLIFSGYIARPVHVRNETGRQDLIDRNGQRFPPITTLIVGSAVIAGLSMALATGLVEGVGAEAGALIFNSIFPAGTPSYFDAAFTEIERIVHEELTEQTINDINATINNLKTWVQLNYTPAKESGYMTKDELTELLLPQVTDLAVNCVDILMDPRYAESGATVFMIGAGMYLALEQELAFVDAKVDDPNDSYHVETIKGRAELYANHLKPTTDVIIAKRQVMIIPENDLNHVGDVSFWHYLWVDTLTGEKGDFVKTCDVCGCDNNDAEEQRDKAMEERKIFVKEQLLEEMGDPYGTAAKWMELTSQPLPNLENLLGYTINENEDVEEKRNRDMGSHKDDVKDELIKDMYDFKI